MTSHYLKQLLIKLVVKKLVVKNELLFKLVVKN